MDVLKYLFIFLVFIIFNHLEKSVVPYSIAILICALNKSEAPIVCCVLFVLSFLPSGSVGLLAPAGIIAFVLMIASLIHKKYPTRTTYGFCFYSGIAVSVYVVLGDALIYTPMLDRIIKSALIVALTFVSLSAKTALIEKGLKFKLGFEEFITVAVFCVLFGLGVCNLLSPAVWKTACVLITLFCCYVYRIGLGSIISSIVSLSLCIYYSNVNYASVFLILSLSAQSVMRVSRFLSAPMVILSDCACYYLLGAYYSYNLLELIPTLLGCTLFVLTPTKALSTLKDRLYTFREKHLVRQTINRNRLMLSNKLYELSGVFTEISNSFNLFTLHSINDDKAKATIEKQIYQNVCSECENFSRCSSEKQTVVFGLNRMVDIGFAKGKLSLIDFPREFSTLCTKPNNVLYGINRLLADYRSYLIDQQNVKSGRDLIASEALGIAEILRTLALETGSTLKYHTRIERALSENLLKAGFIVNEILIYGEEDRLSVSMIVAMKDFSSTELQSIISKTLNISMCLTDKADLSEDKCYLLFSKSAEFDAVFGIAKTTKDGSDKSGDTHSVTRIAHNRFLVALSDGMGSGTPAESISSASLSLIECFYKAGLNSSLILNTVNKVLAINTEDSFTALDVAVIDLDTSTADFIKYGSPYGFIISENGIKIVEGTSLPLGIIEEIKPSVCSTSLSEGDVVLLVSDGVSDAFGSSSEIIDFLRTLPAKNPQTLANQVLEKALLLNGGKKNDDMTALAVRIFKKVV